MKTSNYNGYKVNLVESMEDLNLMKSRINPLVMIGLDTETTGLDFNNDYVVGVCISCGPNYSINDYQGYYIPVRHIMYQNNIEMSVVMELVQYIVDNCKVALFNRPFDFSMLEKEGINIPFVGKTHDIQIMAHLVTNESFPALKGYVKTYLKMDVIEFSSNKAVNHNFATTDPCVSYIYAAQDPLVTVLLGRKLWNDYPYIRKIYALDNKASEAVRFLSTRTLMPLKFSIIERELELINEQIISVKNQIFALTGYQFKLNSNRDKADALNRVVTLTAKTKGGQFAVNDEVLSQIDHPLAKLFQKYAELEKYRGTYLDKMSKFPKEGIRINYSTVNVATGRLSSGSSSGNNFFANFNIQNVPKVELYKSLRRDDGLGYIVSDDPFVYTMEESDNAKEVEMYEIELDNGTVIKVDGESSVKIIRNNKEMYSQVKNLQETDILVEDGTDKENN